MILWVAAKFLYQTIIHQHDHGQDMILNLLSEIHLII